MFDWQIVNAEEIISVNRIVVRAACEVNLRATHSTFNSPVAMDFNRAAPPLADDITLCSRQSRRRAKKKQKQLLGAEF